jgi:hypothetical protein
MREDNLVQLAALVGQDAPRLQAIARSLYYLGERRCNGFQDGSGNWDEAAEIRAEKREDGLVKQADDLAAAHGLRVYYQGDLRGWPLYLWDEAALAKYNNGASDMPPLPIGSCYSSVGVGVCPQ